ncbi:hypothetical protein [Longispora albida]|uniref:hypothetical protein n=1 Tax=Longispora albida TaxID=203523 RepID=UPI00035CF68B|nr:hypothetical protein [Longispora albida]
MLPASTELAAAIESPERRPVLRLRADWDGDGYGSGIDDLSAQVGSISVDRALSGELPDEVALTEGAAAAALSAELTIGDPADSARHAAWWFSRTNPASPLAGRERLARPVTADIGMMTATGTQYLRRFTGLTRSVTADAARRTVKLDALDYREFFRHTTAVPAVETSAGLSGTWIAGLIAYGARAARGGAAITFDAAPRGAEPDVYAPMWGSTHPYRVNGSEFSTVIGLGRAYSTAPNSFGSAPAAPAFIPGRYVLAADAKPGTVGWQSAEVACTPAEPPGMPSGTRTWQRVTVAWWTRRRNEPLPDGARLRAGYTAFAGSKPNVFKGSLWLGAGADHRLCMRYAYNPSGPEGGPGTVYRDVYGPAVPDDGGWHHAGVSLDLAAGQVRFFLNGTETTATFDPAGLAPLNLRAAFTAYQPVCEVMIWHRTGVQWPHEPGFVPTARLDTSALDLVGVLDHTPREAWALLKELAAAEQATVMLDEQGVFHYRTRAASRRAHTPVRALTAANSLLGLASADELDRVRNQITVTYRPVRRDLASSLLYESTEVHRIEPRSRIELWVAFTKPAYAIDPVSIGLPAPSTQVTLARNPDGTGDPGTGETGMVVEWQATKARLLLTNGTGDVLYTANTAGTPTISVAGYALIVGPEVEHTVTDAKSVQRFGPQPLTLPAGPWVQTQQVADALGAELLSDLAWPQPAITGLDIIGDPRLQLGDRVRVTDPDGLALDGEYWISGITDRLSSSGYTQTITARRAPAVLRWGQGAWGTHAWGITA